MAGVGLVVWGWAIVGMLVETYGFWLLFAGFVPTALSFLRRIPIFGRILDVPLFKKVICIVLARALACYFHEETRFVTVDTLVTVQCHEMHTLDISGACVDLGSDTFTLYGRCLIRSLPLRRCPSEKPSGFHLEVHVVNEA